MASDKRNIPRDTEGIPVVPPNPGQPTWHLSTFERFEDKPWHLLIYILLGMGLVGLFLGLLAYLYQHP